jgi:hypothetical protein
VARWEHTASSLDRQLDRAEATAAQMVAAEDAVRAGADPDAAFPPTPGPQCSWCDFRRWCPDGRAQSSGREPWAALTPR